MFRLYSKGCEYAIRALVYMAQKRDEPNLRAKDICRKARIPESFTRKVFQSLVKGKYLEAVPGNGGGYRLAKDPRKISILEIVEAVDGRRTFDRCLMGSASKCSSNHPCALHADWMKTKNSLLLNLEARRLKDLVCVFQSTSKKY